jgi:hypothetical protein
MTDLISNFFSILTLSYFTITAVVVNNSSDLPAMLPYGVSSVLMGLIRTSSKGIIAEKITREVKIIMLLKRLRFQKFYIFIRSCHRMGIVYTGAKSGLDDAGYGIERKRQQNPFGGNIGCMFREKATKLNPSPNKSYIVFKHFYQIKIFCDTIFASPTRFTIGNIIVLNKRLMLTVSCDNLK